MKTECGYAGSSLPTSVADSRLVGAEICTEQSTRKQSIGGHQIIPGTADLTCMFRHHVLQTRVILRTEHTKTEHGESLLCSDVIFSSRTKTEQAS
ncbi:hypothetical protein PVAP13_J186925 [Panicum virgatum]|nr:hypothetical protein PVAP13_J186925 [Panicum virgatum]